MPRRTHKNRTIEIILLESDKHLGEKFEVVRVAPIFAKNVLLPQSKAVLATKGNLNTYQQKMQAAEEKRAKRAADFEDMIMKIQQDGGLTIEKNVNEKGVLYSKIDAKEIATLLTEKYDLKVEPHFLKLKKKISQAGEFHIPFFYQSMEKEVHLNVKGNVTKEKKSAVNSMNPKAKPVEEASAEPAEEVEEKSE